MPSFSAVVAEIAGQISGLIDEIDQILPDHTPHGIGNRQGELLAEPVGQRGLGGNERFEIIVFAVAAARADAGPFRIAGRSIGAATPGRAVIGRGIVQALVGPFFFDRAWRFALGGFPSHTILDRLIGRLRAGRNAGRRLAIRIGSVEQGVALQFGLDIGDEVEIGELQQLDGLHQLRRHHQGLALPKLEFWVKAMDSAKLVQFLLVWTVYSRPTPLSLADFTQG